MQIYAFYLTQSFHEIKFNFHYLIINELQYKYKRKKQLDLLISACRVRSFWRIKGQNKKSDRKRFYRFGTAYQSRTDDLLRERQMSWTTRRMRHTFGSFSDTFPFESECKSTNIFRIGQIFFQTFSHLAGNQRNIFPLPIVYARPKSIYTPFGNIKFTPPAPTASHLRPPCFRLAPDSPLIRPFLYSSYIVLI